MTEQFKGMKPSRRAFLRGAAAVGGATAMGTSAAAQGDPAITELKPWNQFLGEGVDASPYGMPSKFEAHVRRQDVPWLTADPISSINFTPLHEMDGIITPNGLCFERHHGGVAEVDPAEHRIMINGLVDRELVFTMEDLMRFPRENHVYFLECAANSGMEWRGAQLNGCQYTHGMISCAEFTGVLLSTVLEMCGIDKKRARYVLAEGADGSSMTRTISMETAMDDVIVAWGMNGEMLRPENGYPLRLVVPGVQGVSWVKYLRRIEVGDKPYATKDEAVHYIDLQPDGQHRQYTSIQECKSVITTPSGGQTLLDQGYYNISGLAWSGRGSVKRVDVSVDGGRNWRTARMEGPVLSKALTRFNIDWVWDGKPAIIQSRAIDSTGYVQPKINQLRAVRGTRSVYHNNAIQSWKITENGEVSNVQVY